MSATTMDRTFSLGALTMQLAADSRSGARPTRQTSKRISLTRGALELHGDQRGAIMVMGLCMACFLIGSLWTLIGIGDAIVFRDSMQEVADHAAFTSAALHAKGMNFISALNLVMLALVFFHILLGIVNDVLFLACLIPFVDIIACPLFADAHEIYANYGNDIMKPACTGLHYAEEVAGYAYPWLAAYKGYSLGSDYGKFGPKQRDLHVFVISTSLVPGTALDALVNKAFTKLPALQRGTGQGNNQQKIGLPVAAHPYNAVCVQVAKEAIDTLFGFLHVRFLSKVAGAVKGLIGAGVKYRYCNSLGFQGSFTDLGQAGHPNTANQVGRANQAIDKANTRINDSNAKLPQGSTPDANVPKIDETPGGGGLSAADPGLDQWWGHDGPYYPWGGSQNGSPWQEVWALNLKPDYVDHQEHRVSIAQHKIAGSTVDAPFGYLAEAEFYFDCKSDWSDASCDGDDNAAYSVQWRARLRRLEFPSVAELIGSYAGNFLSDLTSVSGAFRSLQNGLLRNLPVGPLQRLVGPAIMGLKNAFNGEIQKLGSGLGNNNGTNVGGAYH